LIIKEKIMTVKTITPKQLVELCKADAHLDVIDVLTPVVYRVFHADLARNLPLDRLDPEGLRKSRNGSADQPLYVICRSGNRSNQACQKLLAAGYQEIVNVEGGTQAWEEAGLPVVRGKKAMSLERQVRIAAGFLVVLGVALSWFHPGFLALSGFVGAGLMFAGITDTCGMGMLLAKMPWNQVSDECSENQCSV
jgi:rhodanese-related sulfurtransferase